MPASDGLEVSTSGPSGGDQHRFSPEHRTDSLFPDIARDGEHHSRLQSFVGRGRRQVLETTGGSKPMPSPRATGIGGGGSPAAW